MDELRPRFDVSERNDETPRPRLPSTGFSERSSSKVPYLLHSSSAWLALRGYHAGSTEKDHGDLVGLCLVVLMLIEVFLNEYVMLFSNPWVVGTEAESMCIAAACCTSILLLSWSSHACHTGVLLILDAARDDSFLVFRSLFRLSRINSRTALPSGSMSMLRSGHLFWKCSDLIVQLCIYGSLDILPFLVALATGRPSDWLTCVAWVSFCHMAMFWLLVRKPGKDQLGELGRQEMLKTIGCQEFREMQNTNKQHENVKHLTQAFFYHHRFRFSLQRRTV
eukprot:s360_g2.t1